MLASRKEHIRLESPSINLHAQIRFLPLAIERAQGYNYASMAAIYASAHSIELYISQACVHPLLKALVFQLWEICL